MTVPGKQSPIGRVLFPNTEDAMVGVPAVKMRVEWYIRSAHEKGTQISNRVESEDGAESCDRRKSGVKLEGRALTAVVNRSTFPCNQTQSLDANTPTREDQGRVEWLA